MEGSSHVVAVLGAGGIHGAHIVRSLSQAGTHVRAVVHRPEQEAARRADGARETASADFEDGEALARALDGVQGVYMIPPALHPREDELAVSALRVAERSGVERFVYVSVLHPHTPALRHHMRKAAAEAVIREGSLSWTILQPSIYAQMALAMVSLEVNGVVSVPFSVDSPLSVVDLQDIGDVAVRVLTDPGHEYASYELAGPITSMGEMALEAAGARGSTVRAVRVDPDLAPLPPTFPSGTTQAEDMRAMFHSYDAHGLVGSSRVLSLLLGREPASFAAVAARQST